MIIAVLAGGLSVRLGALTKDTPKCLLPVAGEPFLGHQLRLLGAEGVQRVHLCLGHLGSKVIEYVGDGARFGLKITYTMEESGRLMGTAGALALASDKLGERFGVMYGDSYLPVRYAELCETFQQCPTMGMMTVWRNRGKFDRSNVAVENGLVTEYSADHNDAGVYEWIDYGLSFLQSKALDAVSVSKPTQLCELWRDLAARRQLSAYVVNSRFYEIGSPSGYRELCEMAETGRMPIAEQNQTG